MGHTCKAEGMGKFWSSGAKPLDLYCFSSTSLGSKWDLYSEGPECPSHGPWEGEMEQKRKMLNQ